MLKTFAIALATTTALTMAPATASADWLLTPYLGLTFGGDTTSENVAYGFSAAWMGAGIIGFEVDFGVAPSLFDTDDDVDIEDFELTDSSATNLMANLIVGAPLGEPGIRPYVSGGAGLLRRSVTEVEDLFDVDENSFGINFGGGLVAFVSDNVGIRGDVRYFRSFSDTEAGSDIDLDLGAFDFWRGTVGVTFRF